MSAMDLQFQHQFWLLASLLIAAAVFILFRFGNKQRRSSLQVLLHPELLGRFTKQVSTNRRRLKQWILILCAAMLAVGLARPQLGYLWEESPMETTDILIALDTSRSMLAPDLKPNRLTRAKLEIESFVQQLKAVRVGLIPFAGDAFLWCPLTYDTDTFLDSLRSVEIGIIPTGGTNLLSAVETAERSFIGQETGKKIMILITDGENLQGQIEGRLPQFARQGWVVHTIGIGTEDGELIPILRPDGGTSFVTDPEGNVVKSKLDAATLQTIASATGGSYHALGPNGQGLYELYENVLRAQLESREESRLRKIPIERYAWVVAFVLALLALELLLRDRRSAGRNVATPLLLMIGIAGIGSAPSAAQASTEREAQQAYTRSDYASAERLYQQAAEAHPDRLPLQYNLGVSALRNDNFPIAKQAFDAALQSTDLDLQQSAYYNRANTQYFLGQTTLDTEPQKTVEQWEQAIQDYERALALDPEDADAVSNKAEVERLLERLKELLQNEDSEQDSEGDSESESQDESDSSENSSSDSNTDPSEDASSQGEPDSDSQENPSSDAGDPSGQEQGEPEPQSGDSDQPGSDEPEPSQPEGEEGEPEAPPEPEAAGTEPEPADASAEPEAASTSSEAGEASGEPDPQEQEALRLLESLKQEDGDAPQLLFRMQNPDAEDDTPEMDW